MKRVLISVMAVASWVAGLALAAPPAWTTVREGAVQLLANTPGGFVFDCDYRVVVTFTDGEYDVQRGRTDLPAGAASHVSASWLYEKPIREAVLDDWNCAQRIAPRPAFLEP